MEHIANAYEDRVNNALFNDSMKEELAEIYDFISNDAHLVNALILTDPNLPNSPSVKEALAGPE